MQEKVDPRDRQHRGSSDQDDLERHWEFERPDSRSRHDPYNKRNT
jgi:hypothetical protein